MCGKIMAPALCRGNVGGRAIMPEQRKHLSWQIRKLHRSELKKRRATRLATYLHLRRQLSSPFARQMVQQPLADEFADLFELDFVGPVHERAMPEHLGAVEFTLQELQRAIGRLKVNKAPDTVGIAVELIPDDFLAVPFGYVQFRVVQWFGATSVERNGIWNVATENACRSDIRFPTSCKHKIVLREHFGSSSARGAARLSSKLRLEEHLVSATMFLDKGWASGKTIWVVSLDLSKHVHWPALWAALETQGVSQHLIWLLHQLRKSNWGSESREWPEPRIFNFIQFQQVCDKGVS